jgi:hypothetical protein
MIFNNISVQNRQREAVFGQALIRILMKMLRLSIWRLNSTIIRIAEKSVGQN